MSRETTTSASLFTAWTMNSLFAESFSLGTDVSFEIGTSDLVLTNWSWLRGNSSRGMVKKEKKWPGVFHYFLHLLPMTKIAQHSVHEFFMFITNSPPYAELHLARLHLASVYEVQRGNIN